MFHVKGFFDYCVSEKCFEKGQYENTVKLLYDYGYRTIAIEQVLDLTKGENESSKKKKKGEPRNTADPVPEPFLKQDLPKYADFRVLNRLTIVFATQDVLYRITKSPNLKKYDILAAYPTSIPATAFTCGNFEADIFCFSVENKGIRRTRKMYNQLIERAYHFEILYSPAIEDRGKRKNIIIQAHNIHTMAKSRNVIISSGATHPGLIRSPYDVINLGLIFGLNEHQSKSAVLYCGIQIYNNSIARRNGKTVMFVEQIEEECKTEKITENIEKDNEDSVLLVVDSDEEMETDQPATKKAKQ